MPLITLLYFLEAQLVSGTTMPIATMMLITTLVVSFCKDGGVSISVNLWFLLVYVQLQQSDKQLHTEHAPLRTINLH